MTDRERIAELQELTKLIFQNNYGSSDTNDRKLAKKILDAGYTRQPEPSGEQNKVDIKELFCQIENLFPELKAAYWESKEWSEFTSEWDTITRMPPEPSELASISETNNVPAPIPEAKKKAGTEPSSERAEKAIQLLQKHITLHSIRGHGVFNITSFEEIAREILSLFPEPVLTRISDHEIEILLQTSEHDYYNVTEGDKAIAQAQLAHNQKQIKGE